MEPNIVKPKAEKKKGVRYVSINSEDTRVYMIKSLNDAIDRYSDEKLAPIPISPVPNVSFWVDNEEGRCGFTITRENAKYGWRYDASKETWSPCVYMQGMGYDKVVFTPEENSFLCSLLFDNCKKIEYVKSLIK